MASRKRTGQATRAKPAQSGEAARLKRDYELLTNLASTDEAGSLAKPRSVLLLWFLRNVVGLDDLEAYEFVCDGDKDHGIDGLYLEQSTGDEDHETLVIFQSKYTGSPTDQKRRVVSELISSAAYFKDPAGLKQLLDGDIEEKLGALIERFDLEKKLKEGRFEHGRLRIRLVLVTTGLLSGDAEKLVKATNGTEGLGYLSVYDLRRLGPIAEVVAAPETQAESITAVCDDSLVIVGEKPNRVAVAAVKATDIVQWDGLDSRSLFALNVRRELRKNKVRDQLDGALRRQDEHPDFLAYHNGMTVVCLKFSVKDGVLTAEHPSVVNGAQSAIAFERANNEDRLTEDLRIFVKFVEVAGKPQLAKGVSWRSNTQTAVNARNLMALGGPQARLKKEVEPNYEYIYEITPDASYKAPEGKDIIQNDEAAQLLCAIFNAMPWLAVKRLSLFESDNHAQIFKEDISGAHVVLAQVIRECVDAGKQEFPEAYRNSWRLTRLVAVYLVAQILMANDNLKQILDNPQIALADERKLRKELALPVRVAATVLAQRRDGLENDNLPDNFSVDFKNQQVLLGLRAEARKLGIAYKRLGPPG